MQQTTLRGGIALVVRALASGAAGAQSVTLYGLVDTGIEYVSHANSSGNGLVRMPSITGTLPSRWGLRGAEDLGGGIQAVFTLESGFNTDTGTSGQGGRLFGRQAWVGLAGGYGTLTLGRQYSMSFLSLGDADLLGPSQYAIGSLDTYIPNARTDNTVAYKGTFGGLTVGATYSFGRDAAGGVPASGTCAGEQAGSASSCRTVSAMHQHRPGPQCHHGGAARRVRAVQAHRAVCADRLPVEQRQRAIHRQRRRRYHAGPGREPARRDGGDAARVLVRMACGVAPSPCRLAKPQRAPLPRLIAQATESTARRCPGHPMA
ncbi:hypothetical protein ACEQUB_p01029 (plasmid) [Ralstonia syzygii]|uniref:Putative outer membrane porin protein n=1 Tax=Ralstonia syzygii R24 TaxID=907261 RepID=G3ACE6_9RALS